MQAPIRVRASSCRARTSNPPTPTGNGDQAVGHGDLLDVRFPLSHTPLVLHLPMSLAGGKADPGIAAIALGKRFPTASAEASLESSPCTHFPEPTQAKRNNTPTLWPPSLLTKSTRTTAPAERTFSGSNQYAPQLTN